MLKLKSRELIKIMQNSGITLSEIAERFESKTTQATISRVSTGAIKDPKESFYIEIQSVFNYFKNKKRIKFNPKKAVKPSQD